MEAFECTVGAEPVGTDTPGPVGRHGAGCPRLHLKSQEALPTPSGQAITRDRKPTLWPGPPRVPQPPHREYAASRRATSASWTRTGTSWHPSAGAPWARLARPGFRPERPAVSLTDHSDREASRHRPCRLWGDRQPPALRPTHIHPHAPTATTAPRAGLTGRASDPPTRQLCPRAIRRGSDVAESRTATAPCMSYTAVRAQRASTRQTVHFISR